jgi:hypothetical protein
MWVVLFDEFIKEWCQQVLPINSQIEDIENQIKVQRSQKQYLGALLERIEGLREQCRKIKNRIIIKLSKGIRDLVERKGFDVNVCILPDKTTLLMYAITKTWGNEPIICLLLELGADETINKNNNRGITALVTAVNRKSPNLVQLLLGYGARVDDISDEAKREAVDEYIRENQLEGFHQILHVSSDDSLEQITEHYKNLAPCYDPDPDVVKRAFFEDYKMRNPYKDITNEYEAFKKFFEACWKERRNDGISVEYMQFAQNRADTFKKMSRAYSVLKDLLTTVFPELTTEVEEE